MSVQNSDYILTALCPAVPGWRSVWYEARSLDDLTMHAEPIACWAIARYTEDGQEFTETVGLVTEGSGLEPLEALDGGGHLGYLGPDDDMERFRNIALARSKRQLTKWREEDLRRAAAGARTGIEPDDRGT